VAQISEGFEFRHNFVQITQWLVFVKVFLLVPTRQRGNPFSTRQRRCSQEGTLARPDWVPTLARGNQKNQKNSRK
jgi:hypothetical protein